ncbi:olfactory receptor 14A16-like, partial [Dryobates pubescens]|uniref:olfactory receptor 14A16-like n=1 Tax=Dryobates pubescens TaxID=118200 RepID=UPI0023B9BB25
LHYETLLGSRVCLHLAAAAWACGFLYALLHTANTFSLPLCQGNALDQFFCEIPQILKLSCSTSYLRELWLLVASVCLAFVCFVLIVVSYVQIFRAVLRIPSQQGRHKAFATCLPHLAVVSLFFSTGFFAYLKPSSTSSPSQNLVVSVLYSVLPPSRQKRILVGLKRRMKSKWRSESMNTHCKKTPRLPEDATPCSPATTTAIRTQQGESDKMAAKPVVQRVQSPSSTSSSNTASNSLDSEDENTDAKKSNNINFASQPLLGKMEHLEARSYGIFMTTLLP